MAKDRARPFSRKHRKYWIPVTGGMIVIGAINVGLGYCTYSPAPPPPQQINVEDEDPAAKMAREAAKRALARRAAEAGDAGVPDAPVLTPAPRLP